MTSAPQVLLAALDVQARTGQQIRPEQLSLSTPCPLWPVREVLNHSIGVTLKFASFAAGHTDRPRAPAGDLVGNDHALALRSATGAARVAWASTDLTRLCYLPFGTFPAGLAAGINLFDVLAHTWDMGTAAGVALHCGDELWAAGLDAACAVLGPGRDQRHYAAAIPAGAAAPPRQRFLAFLGRSEPWPVT
ncbi:MAG TPA: TIGR03086 family metal-binding protein [Streptosporangiaceae bacterium]